MLKQLPFVSIATGNVDSQTIRANLSKSVKCKYLHSAAAQDARSTEDATF